MHLDQKMTPVIGCHTVDNVDPARGEHNSGQPKTQESLQSPVEPAIYCFAIGKPNKLDLAIGDHTGLAHAARLSAKLRRVGNPNECSLVEPGMAGH